MKPPANKKLMTLRILTVVFALGGILSLAIFPLGFSNTSKDLTLPELHVQLSDPEARKQWILTDPLEKISEDFKVDADFKNRVGFWFDIYSRYDSYHFVIHDRNQPWIVHEVVDTTDMMQRPRARWMNRQAAERKADKRRSEIAKELGIPEGHLRIQVGQKNYFLEGLERSAPYMTLMEEIFTERNLPTELVRLPIVESSFNIHAQSRVGAMGPWQIMPYVARGSMRMEPWIDERRSPLKSTRIAADILSQNQRILGYWPFAITAYNHGVGRLRRAVRELGVDNMNDLIKKNNSRAFRFASSNFYACFLAALYAERYQGLLFPEIEERPSLLLAEKRVPRALTFSALRSQYQLSREEFLKYNPDFSTRVRENQSVPRGLRYYVPTPPALVAEREESGDEITN